MKQPQSYTVQRHTVSFCVSSVQCDFVFIYSELLSIRLHIHNLTFSE